MCDNFRLHSIASMPFVSSTMWLYYHLLLSHSHCSSPNTACHRHGRMLATVWSISCKFNLTVVAWWESRFVSRSVILSPILGYAIDRTGRNIYWLIGSITATIVAHALLAFLFVHPILPLVLMGIAYSILAASLWPLVAFLVPKQMLGTAYGLMQSIQNLGFAIMYVLLLSHEYQLNVLLVS